MDIEKTLFKSETCFQTAVSGECDIFSCKELCPEERKRISFIRKKRRGLYPISSNDLGIRALSRWASEAKGGGKKKIAPTARKKERGR